MRGQVFDICNKKIFAFGGGRSEDNDAYLNPSVEGVKNLEANNFKVDYIVSYEPPAQISEFLELGKTDRSHVNTYLEEIREKTDFKRWFFGRHHLNKLIPPKFQAIFDNVIDAAEEPKVALAIKTTK